MRIPLLTALIAAVAVPWAVAQPALYVSLSNSKGYVVGAKLQESGLFRYAEDTLWSHIGWNHPFLSGISHNATSGTWVLAGGNGALRSDDGGESWKITTGWRVTEAQHVAVDQLEPNLVYLATSYGVWRSLDDGRTWYESSRGLAEPYTQAIVADRSIARRVLAATEGGVYASNDAAGTWALVGPETAMVDLAQSPAAPSNWIAGARSGNVYVSADQGVSWTDVMKAESEITAVAADPTDRARFAVVTYGDGVFFTENAGRTWAPVGAGLPTPYLMETIFDRTTEGRLWVATKEQGIYYSDGDGTWTYAGMNGTMVFDMLFVDE